MQEHNLVADIDSLDGSYGVVEELAGDGRLVGASCHHDVEVADL